MGRIGSAAKESESHARFVRFEPACTADLVARRNRSSPSFESFSLSFEPTTEELDRDSTAERNLGKHEAEQGLVRRDRHVLPPVERIGDRRRPRRTA